jgi:hypothetical protein
VVTFTIGHPAREWTTYSSIIMADLKQMELTEKPKSSESIQQQDLEGSDASPTEAHPRGGGGTLEVWILFT